MNPLKKARRGAHWLRMSHPTSRVVKDDRRRGWRCEACGQYLGRSVISDPESGRTTTRHGFPS